MNIGQISKLMEIYKELHDAILYKDNNTEWPDCADPLKRQQEFLMFIDNLPKDDPWKYYYKTVVIAVDTLLWCKRPKNN